MLKQTAMETRSIAERVEDALREVTILFVALAPLDVALGSREPHAFTFGLISVAGGVILFVLALLLERRRGRA